MPPRVGGRDTPALTARSLIGVPRRLRFVEQALSKPSTISSLSSMCRAANSDGVDPVMNACPHEHWTPAHKKHWAVTFLFALQRSNNRTAGSCMQIVAHHRGLSCMRAIDKCVPTELGCICALKCVIASESMSTPCSLFVNVSGQNGVYPSRSAMANPDHPKSLTHAKCPRKEKFASPERCSYPGTSVMNSSYV